MGMGGFVDMLFAASGIYLIYTALMAKKTGTVSANTMLGKNISEKVIKDKLGFIEYMYKRILLAGILIVIAGMINLYNDYFVFSNALTWIASAIILAAIIIYVIAYKNGQKQFIASHYITKKGEDKK